MDDDRSDQARSPIPRPHPLPCFFSPQLQGKTQRAWGEGHKNRWWRPGSYLAPRHPIMKHVCPACVFTHKLAFEVARPTPVVRAQRAAEKSARLVPPSQPPSDRPLGVGCAPRAPKRATKHGQIANNANSPIDVQRLLLGKAATLELSPSANAPSPRACFCTPGRGDGSRDLHPQKFNLRDSRSV